MDQLLEALYKLGAEVVLGVTGATDVRATLSFGDQVLPIRLAEGNWLLVKTVQPPGERPGIAAIRAPKV